MRAYVLVSGLLFGVVTLAHILRLANGWPAQVGGWAVPLELSWIGVVGPGALCAWAFKLSASAR